MGSYRICTVALSPFESLETSLQNTALFPANKEKLEEKELRERYLKPFVTKVKYSTPLFYGFLFSVNTKVAATET